MFSEKQTPVSELIKGDPEKPMREPAIALFAIVFNLFAIYQLNEMLRQILFWLNPSGAPWYWSYFQTMVMMVHTLTGVAIFYSFMLVLGAMILRYINRRAGAALILVFSIFVLFLSFMALAFGGFSLFIGVILGLIAGGLGIRSKREVREADAIEII